MPVPLGRTLSQTKYGHRQDDWPESTQNLTPSPPKPETVSQVQSSSPGFPYPAALHPLVYSLVLSVAVSPWTIHFQGLDESPLSGPGRGLPPVACADIVLSLSSLTPGLEGWEAPAQWKNQTTSRNPSGKQTAGSWELIDHTCRDP